MERTGGRPVSQPAASHELIDHTSEVTLRMRARDFPALIAEATAAFAELVPQAVRVPMDERSGEFLIEAPDRVAGLVEWLNEMVYLCDTCQWLPAEVVVADSKAGQLRIRARGWALSTPFVLVKAATLHGAFIREGGEGLEAEVTLDI